MNTKLLPKEYTDRKKKIIDLNESGLSIQDIKRLTKTHPSVIKRIIERNQSEEKTGFFNVNKHDCWFIPTSYNY